MSNLKRFLAMTLVVVMMIGSLAMTASAKTFPDVDRNDTELIYAIDVLSDLGIIKGYEDGDFGVNDDVERQQMAMFIGRIKTASPEFFESKASKLDAPFTDVIDATFFSAVDYCYTNDIIDGRGENLFDPTANVTLQEAVKMLVSALGYTGLQYPIGYLTQAKEIGLLEGFGIDKIPANANLSRGEVAALLYNYFLSNYVELKVSYNPVSGASSTIEVTTPVCNKFGITKIEGYVTAVQDFSANIVVDLQTDTNFRTTNNTYLYDTNKRYYEFEATPISSRDVNAVSNARDITISWVEPKYTNNPNGTITVEPQQKNYHTKRELLGITESEYQGIQGGRNLLGRKVIGYVNTSTRKINVPRTQIVGTKTDVTADATYASNVLTVAGATKTSFAVTDRTSTTEFDLGTSVYSFGTNQGKDGKNATLKTLALPNPIYNTTTGAIDTPDGILRSAKKYNDDKNTNAGYDSEFDGLNKDLITRMIANRGTTPSYKLEYVDNSYAQDGSEYYFVFTPYRLGYYRNDEDSGKELRFAFINDDNAERLYSNKTVVMADDFSKSVSLAKEKAYLYTQQGDYILVQATLVEEHATFSNTVTSVNGRNVTFNIQSIASTANNYTPYYSTLVLNYTDARAAKSTNLLAKAFDNSSAANNLGYRANDIYRLFSLDGDIIFAYQSGRVETASATTKYYGVITLTGASSIMVNNTIYSAISIYDAGTYGSAGAGDTTILVPGTPSAIVKGNHIVFTKTGVTGSNSICNIVGTPFLPATNDSVNVAPTFIDSTSESGSTLGATNGTTTTSLFQATKTTASKFAYNSATRELSTSNVASGNTNYSSTNAYVNANTVIIAMGATVDKTNGTMAENTSDATNGFKANRLTSSEFEKLMVGTPGIAGVSMIATGAANTTTLGVAKVVWIILQSDIPDAAHRGLRTYLNTATQADRYATVQEINTATTIINGVLYYGVKAYEYVAGAEVTVYREASRTVNVGSVIKFGTLSSNLVVTEVDPAGGTSTRNSLRDLTDEANGKTNIAAIITNSNTDNTISYFDQYSITVGSTVYLLSGSKINVLKVKLADGINMGAAITSSGVKSWESLHADRRYAWDSDDLKDLRNGNFASWRAVITADDTNSVQEITLIKVANGD